MGIEAMKQALEDVCGAKLCEFNSMSSRQEMLRLMDRAIAALRTTIEQAEADKQEPVAEAWDEGYHAGIADERMSEANIGIAGFGAKVEPARNNPYRTTKPATHREWVELTDEEIDEAKRLAHIRHQKHRYSIRGQQITPADDPQWHYARVIEAKSKEKNT